MSDSSLAERPPVSKATQAKVDKLPKRIVDAVEAMVWQGLPFNEAAQQVGLSPRQMRRWLEKPHVVGLLRREKQMLLASDSPRNIHRLREIREAAPNMPAVQAIRDLEAMQGAQGLLGQASSPNGIAQSNPGVTIVIQGTGQHDLGHGVTIDGKSQAISDDSAKSSSSPTGGEKRR